MVSMEFVTPAVTSPAAGPLETFVFRLYSKVSPRKHYIRYVDLHHKGYMKMTVYPDQVIVQWIFVNTIKRPCSKAKVYKTFIYKGLHSKTTR